MDFNRSKFPRTICAAILLAATVTLASQAYGQAVVYSGSVLNLGPGWRDPSVVKPLDLDGNNVFGTDGYVIYATSPTGTSTGVLGTNIASLPSYLTLNQLTTSQDGGFLYATIDNPVPGGTFAGTIESGVAFTTAGTTNVTLPLVSFTLNATAPGDIRVGYFSGDSHNDVNSVISMSGPNGANASTAVVNPPGAGEADYYFFDIIGGSAGQTYTISGNNSANVFDNVTIGGLTFDSLPNSTPEPGGMIFALSAGVAILVCRAARRRSYS